MVTLSSVPSLCHAELWVLVVAQTKQSQQQSRAGAPGVTVAPQGCALHCSLGALTVEQTLALARSGSRKLNAQCVHRTLKGKLGNLLLGGVRLSAGAIGNVFIKLVPLKGKL